MRHENHDLCCILKRIWYMHCSFHATFIAANELKKQASIKVSISTIDASIATCQTPDDRYNLAGS